MIFIANGAGTPVAGWPADGYHLSGGVAWQAMGQKQKKRSKNPYLDVPSLFGEYIEIYYITQKYIH